MSPEFEPDSAQRATRDGRLDLSWPAIVALGALAAPRVVLHDLGVTDEGFGMVSAILTVVPIAIWVVVLVSKQASSPVRTGVAVGAVYGVLLSAIHQLLWNEAFEDDPPRLGGNLEDRFSDGTEELILRMASVPSSIAVGVALGAVAGLIARYLLQRQDPERRRPT